MLPYYYRLTKMFHAASPNQNSQASSTESGYASMPEGTNSTPNRCRTSSYRSSFERPKTLFKSTEQGGSGMVYSKPETTTRRLSQLVPGARDFVIPLDGQLVTPASTPVTPTRNSNVPISRQFSAP